MPNNEKLGGRTVARPGRKHKTNAAMAGAMLSPLALVAIAIAALTMFAGYVLSSSTWFLVLLLAVAVVVAFVATWLPQLGVAWLDALIYAVRSLIWRKEQGRFYSHGGIAVKVHNDGRHVWIDGDSLRRILGSSDSDEVLAARHAGRWRRFDGGVLMLRADAVVEQLASAPGRLDPRIVRLRHWLEREVIFPAAEKRRRGA